jgi:hypothetical protein
MTISKPTFAPSTPNYWTRVRRLKGISGYFDALVLKYLSLLMGAFYHNFSNFRAIRLGTTKPKLQNGYAAADQNIRTFISNLGYLWLTRASWINSAHSEPSNSSQSGHTGTNVASFKKTRPRSSNLPIFGHFVRDSSTSVRLQYKNSGATDAGWPLLPSWPISCVCMWSIQPSFSTSTNIVFVNIWGYLLVVRTLKHWTQ